jgi:hypothetical protein
MTTSEYRRLHPFCEICHQPAAHTHHKKTRGAGGADEEANYIALCIFHHEEVHLIGKLSFARKYGLEEIGGEA